MNLYSGNVCFWLDYIGFPIASMLSSYGFEVLGVDINSEIVKIINNRGIHIE